MIDAHGITYGESDPETVGREFAAPSPKTAAYCVRLYEGSSFRPWVGREKCGHCGFSESSHAAIPAAEQGERRHD